MREPLERISDLVLVLRIQSGDEEAFAGLVAKYSPRLRFFLNKLLGEDEHRVDDALQDVWLNVYRGIQRLKDPQALSAWLYRIAHDRAAKKYRRRKLPTQPLEQSHVGDQTAGGSTNGALLPEDAEWIHRALDQLSPEHRKVLILRFLEEMTYEDVSRVTQLPIGTVRSRIHYAKGALRRIIERIRDE